MLRLLVTLAVVVALAASAAHAHSLSTLRSEERRLVRSVEKAKTTILWFERHPKVLYSSNPKAKRKAWHAVAVARSSVIRWRARLVVVRSAIARATRPRTVYEQARAEAFRLGVTAYEWAECIVPTVNQENDEPPESWSTTKDYGGGHGNVYEAYGLPQALPGTKMASAGPKWRTDAATQMRWMVGYMRSRYGGICAARAFKVRNGWY